jgi:hypothetical protein
MPSIAIASYILIERQASNSPQWVLVMRPGEGTVEDVNRSMLHFLRLHDLHTKKPRGEVALLDPVEEVFDMVIRFGPCKSLGSLAIHRLDAGFGSEVPFDVDEASILILSVNTNKPCGTCNTYLLVQGVSVHAKGIDIRQRCRNTTRADQMHQSMNAFRVVDMVVPEHIVLRYVHSRVSLMTAVHARELDRVSDEEDRQVIEDEVVVTIFGEELGRPSSDISHGVARALLPSDSGDAC